MRTNPSDETRRGPDLVLLDGAVEQGAEARGRGAGRRLGYGSSGGRGRVETGRGAFVRREGIENPVFAGRIGKGGDVP